MTQTGGRHRLRSAAVATAFVLVGALAACGGDGDDESSSRDPLQEALDERASSETVSESPSEESPSEETPTETSTADIEFTEWELERRARPAPERPTEMDDDGEAGAVATAEYFLQLTDHAIVTGVVDDLAELSHPECTFCSDFLALSIEQVANGRYVDQPGLTIFNARAELDEPTGEWLVIMNASQEGGWDLDAHGSELEFYESSDYTQYVVVKHDGERWFVQSAYAVEIGSEAS